MRTEEEAARAVALSLLARRAFTERELAERLARSFPAEVVAQVMGYVRARGYCSDEEVLAELARRHTGSRAWGRKRLKAAALGRGVPAETFEAWYASYVDEEAVARSLLPYLPPDAEIRARRLLQRGFSLSVVRRLILSGAGEDEAAP